MYIYGTHLNDIVLAIHIFSFKEMHVNTVCARSRTFRVLSVLNKPFMLNSNDIDTLTIITTAFLYHQWHTDVVDSITLKLRLVHSGRQCLANAVFWARVCIFQYWYKDYKRHRFIILNLKVFSQLQ